MNRVAPLVLASLLAGCMQATMPEPPPPPPMAPTVTGFNIAEAKATILRERSNLWKDPYSIRDARISAPLVCDARAHPDLFTQAGGTCICVIVNAKNSYGGYVGARRTLAFFPAGGGFKTYDGAILGFEEYCGVTQPFPEMNGKS